MARRRVLALGPAVSRMMCMTNPYQQIRKTSTEDDAQPRRRPWLLWRRKKKRDGRTRPRKTWGLRIRRLRIRALSPLKLLKRLCDAYVRMMFAFESQLGGAGVQCAVGPAFPVFPMHLPGRMGTSNFDFAAKVR